MAAYCRVSTDSEEQSNSFSGQVNAYTSLIKANPAWTLAEIYADDGITGTSAQKRPRFMQMISDCEAGKIDLILTKSISRFARNTLECLSYVRHLNDIGTHIIFENNGIDTRSNYSEMLLTILAAFAQEESRSISENTKWGIRKRYEVGETRWVRIYGYDKGYVVNHQEAAVVQKVFNLYEHGMTMAEVCDWLAAHHIKSPNGADKWTPQTIDHMLANEKYAGDLKLQKYYTEDHISHNLVRNDNDEVPSYYIDNHHTAIVSHKQFRRVAAIQSMRLRKHSKATSGNNLKANNGRGSEAVNGVGVGVGCEPRDDNDVWHDQYPLGDKLVCPYCKSILHQRGIKIHHKHTHAWCCEKGITLEQGKTGGRRGGGDRGDDKTPCKNFVIRSPYVEDALLKAYEMLSMKMVKAKLRKLEGKLNRQAERQPQNDSTRALAVMKKAAEVMLKIKEKMPVFKRVDYWWVDELVDHIEFGNHSKSQIEFLRERATLEAEQEALQSLKGDGQIAANFSDDADEADGAVAAVDDSPVTGLDVADLDDRTMRIFWRCGIVSTVSSGILTDEDAPRHLAQLLYKPKNSPKQNGPKRGRKSGGNSKKTSNSK